MKYKLEELIKREEEKEFNQVLEDAYWEAVLMAQFDMDSAGDR